VHADLGFTKDSTYVFQLIIDDFSRQSFLEILQSKSEALSAFKALHQRRNNDLAPYKLAIVKTDCESVYTSQVWDRYCDQEGLTREFSGRYRHDTHGVVERGMGVIGTSMRCMMVHGAAPAQDQPDALYHANVIRNNSPTRANHGRTPNEAAAGMKLPMNKRLFKAPLFCLCFAHVYEEERAKHEPRGIACVYLGYEELNNVYKVKEWTTGQRYYTADVTFHCQKFPYRANPTRIQDYLHRYDDMAPHSETEPQL
jgi:hypothetical protein